MPPRLEKLIADLEKATQLTPELARLYLQIAELQVEDLIAWQYFEHPIMNSFGQKQVYDGRSFRLWVKSWRLGDFTAIHQREQKQWSTFQAFGVGEYREFNYDSDILTTKHVVEFPFGAIQCISPETIYQIGNPNDVPFLSLHIYGHTPSQWKLKRKISSYLHVFDLYDQTIQHSEEAPFFCLPTSAMKSQTIGLRADPLTTLNYHRQLLGWLLKILEHKPQSEGFIALAKQLSLDITLAELSLPPGD